MVALYNDLVGKLSARVEQRFSQLEAEYNFDLGDEFEVALCRIFREILPQKFGVCRGYVVGSKSEAKAGDDLIIFDQNRFFTIRQIPGGDFSQKDQIPIEAAYCYIEAKHALEVGGDFLRGSFSKAFDQVGKVKKLCSNREDRGVWQFDRWIEPVIRDATPEPVHEIRNPMLGAIFAKEIRDNGVIVKDPEVIGRILTLIVPILSEGRDQNHLPDLIVAGRGNVVVPTVMRRGQQDLNPFFLSGKSGYAVQAVEGKAFGVGMCFLGFALDWIRLGKFPWVRILADACDLQIR